MNSIAISTTAKLAGQTRLDRVPAGMIALSDWARKRGLSRDEVNSMIAEGQITPTTVELMGYPVRHILADTRLPREKAPKPKDTAHRGGKLPVMPHPNPEMLTLTQWAQLHGISGVQADNLARMRRLVVKYFDGRIYVHRDTPCPIARYSIMPNPNPEMLTLTRWAQLRGISRAQASTFVYRKHLLVERFSGRIYVHRDTPCPEDKRATRPHQNQEMLPLREWAELHGLTRIQAGDLIRERGIAAERHNGRVYVHRDTPCPTRRNARNAQ